MEIESNYLIDIGKSLNKNLDVFNSIPNNTNGYEEGVTNLMAILGAYYSLFMAMEILPHINADVKVEFKQVTKEGKKLLDSLIKNKFRKLEYHNSWFVGYYLNSAAQRISVAFEHLLKLCLSVPPNKKNIDVVGLSRKLFSEKCKTCNSSGKCTEVLTSFAEPFDFKTFLNGVTTNTIKNKGKCLRFVTGSVNIWKHRPWPKEIDLLPRRTRWLLTCFALDAVLLHSNECLKKRFKT